MELILFPNRISGGDGPEVYADMLTKDLSPYVTTQVTLLH